jgi:drug/metabolite transporter (DMT)-like permease
VNWRGWSAFAALSIIWGVPYFFIKLAVADIAPFGVAWGRIALAAAILLPVAWQRGVLRATLLHKRAICAFALVELVGPFSLIAIGERWISSSIAGILIATVPMIVILLSPLFGLKEPLAARRLAGVLVGFAGVVVLLGLGEVSGWYGWAGVTCVLFAAVGYALGPLIVQRYLGAVDGLGAAAASLGLASVVLLPAALWTVPQHRPSPLALSSIAVLGIVCTAIALLLFFVLVKHAGASRAAIITYINPIIATLLGVGLLHERFGVAATLGLALILSGSWFATRAATLVH